MKTLNIKRETPQHKKVVDALTARIELSEKAMGERYKSWQKNEDNYTAYVPASELEKKAERKRETSGEQSFTKIQVPYAYSMLMTSHTYFAGTLLGRSPVFQYTAAHGEPEQNVHAIEALTAYQMQHQGNLATQYIWLMDAGKYGLGVTCSYWEEEMHYVSQIEEMPVTVAGIPMPGRKKMKRTIHEIPGYEGNKIFNVAPYDYIPDPRVPLTRPWEGEFTGRRMKLSYNDIITGKLQGRYIEANAEFVLDAMQNGSADSGHENRHSSRIVLPGDNVGIGGLDPKTGLSQNISAFEMVVTIIPKLWELGNTEYPEKWVFVMTDSKFGQVVLSCRPYGMFHNQFPYHVLECEIDGYSLFKRSMLDIADPLNNIMSWLFNSHFYNVSRSLNGELIYDPSKVEPQSVLDNKPGKRIRLRPSAYGTDVRTAIHSLAPDAAATATNLRDMSLVGEMLQQALGVNEGMLGNTPQGRTSATASRIATSSATSRLKTIVDYFSSTGFDSLAKALLRTSQQMYDGEMKFRIAGDLPNSAKSFIDVTAGMIAGAYDYVPVDGSMPIDRVATVNMWTQLLNQFRQYPELAGQYDVSKIIGWVMQQGGIRNLKQFKVQADDPEVLAAEAAKGNLVRVGGDNGYSMGGGGGPATGRTTEDADRNAGQVPNPGQSGGLGRTV